MTSPISAISSIGTTKLWTCCKCHEVRVSMPLGDCPNCRHARCLNCDVKCHAATAAEIEVQEAKRTGAAGDGQGRSHEGHGPPHGHPQIGQGFDRHSSSSQGASFVSSYIFNEDGRTPRYHRLDRIKEVANWPVFVLRESSQNNRALIDNWNTLLPKISAACKKYCDHLTSIHFLRRGPDEATALPTIIVNTRKFLSEMEMWTLQKVIHKSMISTEDPSWFAEPALVVHLIFKQGRLRRSVQTIWLTEQLPPICEPRNRVFKHVPVSGDSIGIRRSLEHTATLGCYLIIKDAPMILTVDHLIPEDADCASITHLSEQDSRDLRIHALVDKIRTLLAKAEHSCNECAHLTTMLRHNNTNELLEYAKEVMQQRTARSMCKLEVDARRQYEEIQLSQHGANVVGFSLVRSGQSSRGIGDEQREMDWAVFRVVDPSISSHLLTQHQQHSIQNQRLELQFASAVRPNALVTSIGRTSGHQNGQISNTACAIFQGEYITLEWSVIKRLETSVEDWVKGGIGVDGDSGAMIIDDVTHEIYGMLWGRTGAESDTVTLFTPICDILKDIKEKFPGQPVVALLKGQQLFCLDTASGSSLEESEEPETVQRALAAMSIGWRSSTSPLSTSPSSTSPARRLPFERYRTTEWSVLDSPIDHHHLKAPVEHYQPETHDPGEWLGSHTYFRYAVADEDE